jgi:diguanylate cyclase (GGDEF)-like protein/PAS domain S-box-containing protein
VAAGAGFLPWLRGVLAMDQALMLSGVLLAAILVTAVEARRSPADHAALRLSFVADFCALLLLGPVVAAVSAACSACAAWLVSPRRHASHSHAILGGAGGIVAMQFAGLTYLSLGGTTGPFTWPSQALAMLGAVAGYCALAFGWFEILMPFVAGRRRSSWLSGFTRSCSNHVLGASAAAVVAELVGRRSWAILFLAAIPLALAYRAHRAFEAQAASGRRRDSLFDSVNLGVCTLDGGGVVIDWNEALERLTGCSRADAVGRPLMSVLPGLGQTRLSQVIHDAERRQSAQCLAQTGLTTPAGPRLLDVTVIPDAAVVTLHWGDATERAGAEQQLKRTEERLALVADGASDGLWELDLRSQSLFVSGPWCAMVGLGGQAATTTSAAWFDRVHPEDLPGLQERLEAHVSGQSPHFVHQHRIRREDGTFRQVMCRGIAARSGTGRATRVGGSMTDQTDRQGAQDRIRDSMFRDPLTGLLNRTVFVEGLGRRLQDFKNRRGDSFAALYLDLDRFKVVNDSLGHLVGDELLTAVSRRLETCLRDGDELARLGGDEFAVLLNGLGDGGQANAIAYRIQESLSAPFSIAGREVFTSASIGIAFSRPEYDNPEEMMRDADTAMYHAKAHGKARHELFDADMHARALDRLGFENDLRHAVKANAFAMHYQPIVSLASGRCIGFEALIRWKRDGRPVSPAIFVPVAEELGIIEPLGTWVLQEACRTFADWQARFPENKLECITVNVSTRQLMQQNFLHIVEEAVREAGLRPCDLRLEITETTLMDNPMVAAGALRELRNFGVKIYLDDFGTGYSSLSHLHKLPVDALKIDRSFVKSLLLPDRPAIVESILALARTLDTDVVAEGVESQVQARELERLGCRHAQGYHFSRPLSPEAVEQMLIVGEPLGERSGPPEIVLAAVS